MTLDADLRRLRREVLEAGDARIRRVLAVVDALPSRGAADGLIAPLRPRLALLDPPRPLTLARLLFLPLDPLVVPLAEWQPGSLGIPRSLLPVLAEVVAAALGQRGIALRARIAGRTTRDLAVVTEAGAEFWPAAAAVLRDSPPPADWVQATGLGPADRDAIVRPVAALLETATTLHDLATMPGEFNELLVAEQLLEHAVGDGADALAMLLVLLLTHLLETGKLVRLAEDLVRRCPEAVRAAPERAFEFLLAGFDAVVSAESGTGPGIDGLRRAAAMLAGFADRPTHGPSRLARVDTARRRLDETCRRHFASASAALAEQAAAPAASPGAPAALAGDAEVAACESAALDLRRLESVGRRLGDADFYVRALRATTERMCQASGLAPIDRLRIAEIMLGADAALAMLDMPPPR
jgi:hypothetical protein